MNGDNHPTRREARVVRLPSALLAQAKAATVDGYAIVGRMPRRATGAIFAPNGEQVHCRRCPRPKRPDLHRVETASDSLGWVEWSDDGLWSGERADGMVRFHFVTKRDAVLWVVYRAGEA